MPTGPKHYQDFGSYLEACRCTIGRDHDAEDSGEQLDVHQAADIWLSSGMDEDRMFGYSVSELRRAAGLD